MGASLLLGLAVCSGPAAAAAGPAAPPSGPAGAPSLSPAQVAAAKAADDKPGTNGWLAPVTAATAVHEPGYVSPAKAAAANRHAAATVGMQPMGGPVGGNGYGWGELHPSQQGQWTSYYCGPATLVETLAEGGHWHGDQNWAAGVLGTSPDGGTFGGRINPALNAYSDGFHYDEVAVPESGWQNYVSDFESHVRTDIWAFGEGVTAVAYEVPGGPHLVGHPNQLIYHFFAIDGYFNSGTLIHYADSATTVWSSVPPYSNYDAPTLVEIISGRSYDW